MHEQSKTFFQKFNDISYGNGDNQSFDDYSLTEQNDFCKTEVNSDPFTAENCDPLKEIKTELLPADNDLKAYYEKISENGNSELSFDSIEDEQAFKHLKQKRNIVQEENQRKFQCKYCVHFYSVETSLKKHVTKCHTDIIHDDEIFTEEVEAKSHSCPKCDENFDDLLMVWFTLKF